MTLLSHVIYYSSYNKESRAGYLTISQQHMEMTEEFTYQTNPQCTHFDKDVRLLPVDIEALHFRPSLKISLEYLIYDSLF